MSTAKYTLTKEHRAQLKPWAQKWINNALSTKPMDEAEREICRDSIIALYKSANLEPPPRHRIIFVASPFIARFASGFAAAIWHLRKTKEDKDCIAATPNYTDKATGLDILMATRDAILENSNSQEVLKTLRIHSVDEASLFEPYNDESLEHWFIVPGLKSMRSLSDRLGLGEFGMQCAQKAWRFYQGGNAWSGWSSFITFFRYVAKLDVDYSKWDAFEKLSEHSGYRFVHEKFCIISDRPELLTVNATSQPHNETGPFCRWRDGSSLFALNGVRMPAKYVLTPAEKMDPQSVMKEQNVEIRRELIRKVGIERMLATLKHKVLHTSGDYSLLSVCLSPEVQDARCLKMVNPSIGCFHIEFVAPECSTVEESLKWRNQNRFVHAEVLT